ncbi:MAG: 3-oxoacyl-ACP synthase [Flavobacteriaceae bacterium]|nr:3-oxoacyl-ACP synthase [Flavobacteriaceae bacterium]|tara:strand:+ start:27822 stop:28805 length:984 start_codon:yes stop_codon:yes gene_type:complete
MNKAAITGIGGYVPDHVLSNKDLEKMIDTTDEWIISRTGIKERRILNNSRKATSYLAIKAANNLINKKKLNPESIDLVIVATITPDLPVAATAPYVASQIGAKNAFAYDLQAACSGFLYGMSSAVSYINSGRYKKVLLIGADKMSSIVDYKDRATCVLFGDGGGAVLFEKSKNNFGWEDEFFRSNGEDRMALKIKAGGSLFPTTSESYNNGWHNIYQDGKTVFKYAVSEMSYVTEQIFKRNNLNNENVNFLVPHQANKRIIDATIKRINLSEEKVLMNISKYGNTTAATIPLLLHDYESKFKLGDSLVFSAFGGGFTWGSSYLTWAY